MNVGWLAVALSSGLAVAGLTYAAVRPPRALAGRVAPYATAARTSLGRRSERDALPEPGAVVTGGTLRRLLQPVVAVALRLLSGVVDPGAEGLRRRLRQSGLYRDVPEAARVAEHRIRQAGAGLAGLLLGGAAGLALVLPAAASVGLGALGAIAGTGRVRARLDRALEERRARIRADLATIDQVLAMHVRVGGGIVGALQRIVERSSGPVAEELADVVRRHRSGVRLHEALARAAAETPEPQAARTYRLLAAGAEYGADLATGLRRLADDLRASRVEELHRQATRRRAAVLIPVIAILAPVMLLFIAAPLPALVFGGFP